MENPTPAVSSLSILLGNLVIESPTLCAVHGERPRKALVSLKIEGDYFLKASADDIGDTLDYGHLAQRIDAAKDALFCQYQPLEEKIAQIMREDSPNFSKVKGNLRFVCCKALEKPHCFSFTNSLGTSA